jgi:hypothetical protein
VNIHSFIYFGTQATSLAYTHARTHTRAFLLTRRASFWLTAPTSTGFYLFDGGDVTFKDCLIKNTEPEFSVVYMEYNAPVNSSIPKLRVLFEDTVFEGNRQSPDPGNATTYGLISIIGPDNEAVFNNCTFINNEYGGVIMANGNVRSTPVGSARECARVVVPLSNLLVSFRFVSFVIGQ